MVDGVGGALIVAAVLDRGFGVAGDITGFDDDDCEEGDCCNCDCDCVCDCKVDGERRIDDVLDKVDVF